MTNLGNIKERVRFSTIKSCQLLLAVITLCWLSTGVLAQPSPLERVENGLVNLSFGALYVPTDFTWKEQSEPGQITITGQKPGHHERIIIVSLDKEFDLEKTSGVELVERYISKFQNPARTSPLKIQQKLSAPYPWPNSQELRIEGKPLESVYVLSLIHI